MIGRLVQHTMKQLAPFLEPGDRVYFSLAVKPYSDGLLIHDKSESRIEFHARFTDRFREHLLSMSQDKAAKKEED